jgi:hypothetical protein
MRLFEIDNSNGVVRVDPKLVDTLILVLRNQKQLADKRNQSAQLTYDALSQFVSRNYGSNIRIDQSLFTTIFDMTPALQSVVKDHNQDGVELSTENEPSNTPDSLDNLEPTTNSDTVQKAARSSNPYM